MGAEYLFKKYLNEKKISGWKVGSAGITARPQDIKLKTIETLEDLGVKKIKHKQRKLTKKILNDYDIVVAMSTDHFDIIKNKFNYKNVILFSELAENKSIPILDIDEEIKNKDIRKFKRNKNSVNRKISKTIRYIEKNIPNLFKNASERYYLFVDFVNKNILHRNGFPFIGLYETKNTITFMSLDIPSKEDGHILVIPKKRYEDFSEIPKSVLSELTYSIQKIGNALKLEHGGYNILLNNGRDAGQYIFHSHFHIIPRRKKDGIEIEEWVNKKMSKKDFIKINKDIKKKINSVSV